jgi:NADH-quinone oxidoreductase subunit G
MAQIEIDGKKVEAELGSMIIEAADHAGIWIPRFCYHKKLSIAANCRMCLIDVEKAPKPLPACATPITDGMKIWTRSQKALQAQKSVMEFLLINHPLDCPICDQGGECELQDIAMGYGPDNSRYTEGKRSVLDENIGPLVATDMTRCIQCTRCVRFGTEVAGLRELGATGRGEELEIKTFVGKSLVSELSGNIIDICPVGALTSKPYRFTARAWELAQKPSIAPHDCVGSHIFLHLKNNEVMRVVPKENESINEVWLSDRDRFSYQALSQGRLEKPQRKVAGQWQAVEWEEALTVVSKALLAARQTASQNSKIAALVSPNATTEECYLLQKLLRGLGSHNIDHRLRQMDFRDDSHAALFPNAGLKIADIETQSAILLVGSDIRAEQPLLSIKLRKAIAHGGHVFMINPSDFSMNFDVAAKIIVENCHLGQGLEQVLKSLIDLLDNPEAKDKTKDIAKDLINLKPSETAVQIAKQLLQEENTVILLGALALHHPDAARIRSLCYAIAELSGAKFGTLTEGSNAAGAWIAGAVPHRQAGGEPISNPGFNALEICSKKDLETVLLFNIDPELDCLDGPATLKQLQKIPNVIAFTPFESETLREVADLLLPICPFSENTGCFVNMEGHWQTFKAAAKPLAESRPAWKILRVLGNFCELPGFDYQEIDQVLYEIKTMVSINETFPGLSGNKMGHIKAYNSEINLPHQGYIRLAPTLSFSADNLLRRATALQETEQEKWKQLLQVNAFEAEKLGVKAGDLVKVSNGDNQVTLGLSINDQLPNKVVLIPAASLETMPLGPPYALVEVERV